MAKAGCGRIVVDVARRGYRRHSGGGGIMADQNTPAHQSRVLYKFISLHSEFGRPAFEEALLRNRLWWSNPNSFNDPFDCKPSLNYDLSPLRRSSFARHAARNVLPNQSRATQRRAAKFGAAKPPKLVTKQLKETFERWIDESAVACFTRTRDNMLLWSHYADKHQGVCLTFVELLDIHNLALDVTYSRTRPLIRMGDKSAGREVLPALLTKADFWRYEHEARMIDWKFPAGYRDFPAPSLIGLTLGARISAADQKYVADIVLKSRRSIIIERAELASHEYRLKFVPWTLS